MGVDGPPTLVVVVLVAATVIFTFCLVEALWDKRGLQKDEE